MPAPRKRSSRLKGSKAAPGPSKQSFERAANRGAFNAGKNYKARTAAKPKPSPTPRATSRPTPTKQPSTLDRLISVPDIFKRK